MISYEQHKGEDRPDFERPECERCEGTGKIGRVRCPSCLGLGYHDD